MIWLTWRQHRKQVLFAVIGLAVLAAALLPTGLQMHDKFDNSGLGACLAKLGTAQLVPVDASNSCQNLSGNFSHEYGGMSLIAILLLVLPLLVGLFFGAPLVAREVEHGTHRFVWTQGVSRLRWGVVKFSLVGGMTLLLAAAYGLGAGWWAGPLTESGGGRLMPLVFDFQGIAPIGYTVFAVALGIFVGTVWRKVLPAMGVTVVGFIGVRILVETLLRPRYLSAQTFTFTFTGDDVPNPSSGDWVYGQGVRNAAGQLVAPGAQVECNQGGISISGPSSAVSPGGPGGGGQCGGQVGFGPGDYNWEQYQPGTRFWAFQGMETGIFMALAVLLVFFAIRRLGRLS
jgi:hypothetical protein